MKRTLVLAMVFAFVFAFAVPAMAEMPKPVDRVYKGLEMIVKSPLHMVNHPKEEFEAAEFKPFGLIGGLLKGMGYVAVDIVHGAYDVVTSPFNALHDDE